MPCTCLPLMQDVHSLLVYREDRGLPDHWLAGGQHSGGMRKGLLSAAGRSGCRAMLLLGAGPDAPGSRGPVLLHYHSSGQVPELCLILWGSACKQP